MIIMIIERLNMLNVQILINQIHVVTLIRIDRCRMFGVKGVYDTWEIKHKHVLRINCVNTDKHIYNII